MSGAKPGSLYNQRRKEKEHGGASNLNLVAVSIRAFKPKYKKLQFI